MISFTLNITIEQLPAVYNLICFSYLFMCLHVSTYIHTMRVQDRETFHCTIFIVVRDNILKIFFCICNTLKRCILILLRIHILTEITWCTVMRKLIYHSWHRIKKNHNLLSHHHWTSVIISVIRCGESDCLNYAKVHFCFTEAWTIMHCYGANCSVCTA